eukprot:5242656-Pyramimonas_sp.AAC.1
MQRQCLMRVSSSSTNVAVGSLLSCSPPIKGSAVVASGVANSSFANVWMCDSFTLSSRYKKRQDARNFERSMSTWTLSFTVAKSISQTSPCESSSRFPPCKSLCAKPQTICRSNFLLNRCSCSMNSWKKRLMVERLPHNSLTNLPSGSRSSMSGGVRNPKPNAAL